MGEQIVKRVVIAGGGTAGWLAAAALSRQLGQMLAITLVESDEIGTVGVGESTIPTARSFNAILGLDEREFMRATQASFKLGISFEDWARIGDRYIHGFGTLGRSNWMTDFHHLWLEGRKAGHAGALTDYCLEMKAADAGRFETGPDATINYAYHLDASLYGTFLRGRSEARGVRRIEGRIREVEQDPESGFLTALMLESGARIEGDLFIDCTGFRGLLIEQTLHAGYEDWSGWLGTDRAIAMQTQATGPALPFTRAIAHRAGWRWRIPLQHRVGNGLVYRSDDMSDDEAQAMLLAEAEGAPLTEPRVIRYKTGRRRAACSRNCIAMGLASGFVEPLESTSIHLIMIALTRLMQMFPFSGVSEAAIRRFNDQSRAELEHIRDFIVLHYKATERDDSAFWRRCRDMEIPETLAQRIALFREAGIAYQAPDDLFRVDSWVQVMLGQRIEPRAYHHFGRMMRPEQLRQALGDLRARVSSVVERMPPHQQFLDAYCVAA